MALPYHLQYSSKKLPMLTSAIREESQIYEDVSVFLQVFKRAVAVCEAMSANADRGVQNKQNMAIFCNLFEEIKGLANNYPEQGLYGLESSAFSRFVYRLVEILLSWRAKYQNKADGNENPFQLFLKEMDAYLRECEKRKSFLSLINCTQIILLKFANKILANTRTSTNGNVSQAQKLGEIAKRLREELGRLKVMGKLMASKETLSQRIIQAEENSALLEKKEKLGVTNRVFVDIQQGFDKLKGMDIDFAYFRASYFEAKNSSGSFYQRYMESNQQIANAIALFQQTFNNYVKRKQFKAGRQLLKTQRLPQNRTLRHTEYDRSGQTLSEFKGTLPFHINSNQKLTNIYINLNKGNKLRYEQSNETLMFPKNNGKLNKTFEQRPNTLLFDSSFSNLIKERVQTSPNKNDKPNNEVISKKHSSNGKVTKYILSPKVLIKSKCFQMGAMPNTTKNEANIRITPINKFSIRQTDKNKLVNWFSQK